MAFYRLDEYEALRPGSIKEDNLEKSYSKNLDIIKDSTQYFRENLISNAYVNAKKPTVAEVVKDLMRRTGLEEYVKTVNSEEDKKKSKIASEINQIIATATDEMTVDKGDSVEVEEGDDEGEVVLKKHKSLTEVPDIKKSIMNYIDQNKAFQIAPVLNHVKQIRNKLFEQGKIQNNLVDFDVNKDGDLIVFISKHLLRNSEGLSIDVAPNANAYKDNLSENKGEITPAFENMDPVKF